MKKIIKHFLIVIGAVFCISISVNAFAYAVLNITPESTSANLNLTGFATITYTTTNQTKHTINQLTVDPAYITTGNPSGITLINNLCSNYSLPPNGSCTFQLLISGAVAQPASYIIRPRVCGYNGGVCSVPLVSNEVQVTSIPRVAFVTNFGNNTISECTLNSDGTFGTCTQLQDPTFNGPSGVTLNAIGTYVVVANYNSNSISICPLNSQGVVGACTSAQDPSFDGTTSVKSSFTIKTVYVVNYNNNTISICPITSPGVIGTCTTASQSFSNPDTIALNTLGTFAYITNNSANTVSVCPVNADGSFGTCTASNPGGTFHGPAGISINPQLPFAYISNSTNVGGNRNISICPINSDGSLGTCTSYISTLFNQDNFGKITVNSAGTLVYVVNQNNNYVTLCTINPNGQIGSCSQLFPNGTFNSPQGINVGN